MSLSSVAFSRLRPTLSVLGSSGSSADETLFPIRRVFCIGRNYADHAVEMGHDPKKEPPFFFTKPADSVVDLQATAGPGTLALPYPTKTSNLHYEAELVVAIGLESRILGYGLGCDLTRRDLQAEAKQLRRPWDFAKGFDDSAPCGPILPLNEQLDWGNLMLRLNLNNETVPKQEAPLSDMIWSVEEMKDILNQYVRLQPGDLIMTGTPAGVGPLEIGDHVKITCSDGDFGLPPCEFNIGESTVAAA